MLLKRINNFTYTCICTAFDKGQRVSRVNMKLIIGLLLLTSCSTFQKKTLSFISPSTLSFNKQETVQTDKLRLDDSIVYTDRDSFIICQDYMQIKPEMMPFYKNKIHEYYFIHTNKNLIDHVILQYYKGDLAYIALITKGKHRVDSLSNIIQAFFNRNFKNNTFNYNPRSQFSYFNKNNLFIDRVIYTDNYEAEFSLRNRKVKIPSWCGTKTPWWYYLKFWRW